MCRRIQEGEEILASYIDVGFLLRDQRRIELTPWGFSCRLGPMYVFHIYVFLFRCDLCSLSGEDLRRNENMLKKLSSLLNEAKQLYRVGLRRQGQQKLEQLLELVEENLDQFCKEVRTLLKIDCFLIFPFSASSVVLLLWCIACF